MACSTPSSGKRRCADLGCDRVAGYTSNEYFVTDVGASLAGTQDTRWSKDRTRPRSAGNPASERCGRITLRTSTVTPYTPGNEYRVRHEASEYPSNVHLFWNRLVKTPEWRSQGRTGQGLNDADTRSPPGYPPGPMLGRKWCITCRAKPDPSILSND